MFLFEEPYEGNLQVRFCLVDVTGKTYTYTPFPNYNDKDTFTYTVSDGSLTSQTATVTVIVEAVNDAPTLADMTAKTSQDTPVVLEMNGKDIDGDLLTYTLTPAHGTAVSTGAQHTYTYTPESCYSGIDSFPYTVSDGTLSATANITITVTPTSTSSLDLSCATLSSQCKTTGSVVELGANSDGDYFDECYVDISVTPESVQGKLLSIEGERINSLDATDFSGLSASNIGMVNPSNSANKTEKQTGIWLSSATASDKKPTFTTDSDGNTWAKITKRGTLMQIFEIKPGEEYDFSFGIDPTALEGDNDAATDNDQQVSIYLTFYNSDFKALNFLNPIKNETTSTFKNTQVYFKDDSPINEKLRTLTIDCHDHYIYKNGEGIYVGDKTFNHCKDSLGNDQTDEEGTPYAEGDIVYASVEWAVPWTKDDAGTGYALIKNPGIDWLGQIEIELLDRSGQVIGSSKDVDGYYVESDLEPSTIRVYLRTNNSAKSPLLKSVSLQNREVNVTVGSQIATFTKPRIGFVGAITPVQDWVDQTSVRSQCLDYFDVNKEMNCWDFFIKYGVGRWRTNLKSSFVDTMLSGTSYTFEPYDNVTANGLEFTTMDAHFKEGEAKGMQVLMIADTDGSGVYYSPKAKINIDAWFNADTGLLNDAYDPTPGDDSDDQEQSLELLTQWSTFLAETYPTIKDWQIGVENNIGNEVAINKLSDADEAKFLSDMAGAILDVIWDANTQTSLNPSNNIIDRTFDTDYIDSTLSLYDADNYTHFNFNMANDGSSVIPEDCIADYEDLSQRSSFTAWKDKPLVVGAFGYFFWDYDPDPSCHEKDDDFTWEEGFGKPSSAKLTARTLLTSLSMNAALSRTSCLKGICRCLSNWNRDEGR